MDRRTIMARGVAAVLAVGAKASPAAAAARCVAVNPTVRQCEVGLPSFVFQRVAERQDLNEWCWAASLSMIFAYYGHFVSQAQIVSETWGGIANLPGQPGQILADVNRPWVDQSGRAFNVAGDVLSVNLGTVLGDLSQGNPLLIGTLGHCMVLTAGVFAQDTFGNVELQALTVRDPWPFNPSQRILTPAEFYNTSFLARVRVF